MLPMRMVPEAAAAVPPGVSSGLAGASSKVIGASAGTICSGVVGVWSAVTSSVGVSAGSGVLGTGVPSSIVETEVDSSGASISAYAGTAAAKVNAVAAAKTFRGLRNDMALLSAVISLVLGVYMSSTSYLSK